jgi:hypothetical protein
MWLQCFFTLITLVVACANFKCGWARKAASHLDTEQRVWWGVCEEGDLLALREFWNIVWGVCEEGDLVALIYRKKKNNAKVYTLILRHIARLALSLSLLNAISIVFALIFYLLKNRYVKVRSYLIVGLWNNIKISF